VKVGLAFAFSIVAPYLHSFLKIVYMAQYSVSSVQGARLAVLKASDDTAPKSILPKNKQMLYSRE
jgi:hypothetical protein